MLANMQARSPSHVCICLLQSQITALLEPQAQAEGQEGSLNNSSSGDGSALGLQVSGGKLWVYMGVGSEVNDGVRLKALMESDRVYRIAGVKDG